MTAVLSLGQDIGVFEYFKDLIGFKRCGEPSRLMRYIDPREVSVKLMRLFGEISHGPMACLMQTSEK